MQPSLTLSVTPVTPGVACQHVHCENGLLSIKMREKKVQNKSEQKLRERKIQMKQQIHNVAFVSCEFLTTMFSELCLFVSVKAVCTRKAACWEQQHRLSVQTLSWLSTILLTSTLHVFLPSLLLYIIFHPF